MRTSCLPSSLSLQLPLLPFMKLALFNTREVEFIGGRYPVATMHGGARMCQELADLFKTVHQNEKGNRIVGLYGMPGRRKTTLCKIFCNLNLQNFDGKVCYLDFGRGNELDRLKHALRCLCNFSKAQLESLTAWNHWAYKELFHHRDRNERELLVLNNITVDRIHSSEMCDYLKGCINSWLLLSGRSEDVLVKHFDIDSKSCMRVPRLEQEEAIAILLETAFPVDSKLGAQDTGFALKCAKRCLFKETCSDNAGVAPTFHPFALKIFGRHLFRKYSADFSQWVAEADGLEIGSGGGLGDVFIVVEKAFDCMDPKLRTLFVLLSLDMQPDMSLRQLAEVFGITCKKDMQPDMSLRQVAERLEITRKKDIEYIEEAVRDLMMMGFIEEIEPEIRIHDFYLEFAQSKPRWLLSKCNPVTSEVGAALFSKDEAGVEFVNLEYCQNLIALEVVIHRSLSIRYLSWSVKNNVRFPLGMEEGSLHIGMVSDSQVLNLSILNVLQYLYIKIENCGEHIDGGDLTGCVSLREIYVSGPNGCRLSKFPRINGLPHLEIASFERCENVAVPLDCRNCVKLRSLVFKYCRDMVKMPFIDGCINLSEIVLNKCYRPYSIGEYLDRVEMPALYISSSEDASPPECCGGVKNQLLWIITTRWQVPNLGSISNLTVLKLYSFEIVYPPDVTCCSMLEEVYFFEVSLNEFPSFSSLKKLKILCLCNCKRVGAPPDIGGCEGLEVFHLLYNGSEFSESLFRKMDDCPLLREIKLSWRNRGGDGEGERKEDEILADWKDVMPKELEEWQWLQDKEKQVKKCCRGGKGYYCITASGGGSGTLEEVLSFPVQVPPPV